MVWATLGTPVKSSLTRSKFSQLMECVRLPHERPRWVNQNIQDEVFQGLDTDFRTACRGEMCSGVFIQAHSSMRHSPRRIHQSVFTKARSPRRVHQGDGLQLPDVVFHTIFQGIHAVVVFMLAGCCCNQLGSLISDRKAVFRHHGRIRLGWEACLKRIRARFQTHDFVGVALR